MNLVDRILSEENIRASIKRVAANKGAPGVDGMTVDELQRYFDKHGAEIKIQIREKRYQPQPVRRGIYRGQTLTNSGRSAYPLR